MEATPCCCRGDRASPGCKLWTTRSLKHTLVDAFSLPLVQPPREPFRTQWFQSRTKSLVRSFKHLFIWCTTYPHSSPGPCLSDVADLGQPDRLPRWTRCSPSFQTRIVPPFEPGRFRDRRSRHHSSPGAAASSVELHTFSPRLRASGSISDAVRRVCERSRRAGTHGEAGRRRFLDRLQPAAHLGIGSCRTLDPCCFACATDVLSMATSSHRGTNLFSALGSRKGARKDRDEVEVDGAPPKDDATGAATSTDAAIAIHSSWANADTWEGDGEDLGELPEGWVQEEVGGCVLANAPRPTSPYPKTRTKPNGVGRARPTTYWKACDARSTKTCLFGCTRG